MADEAPSNFLAPYQCLVYIENLLPFADADGSTCIARIIRSFINNDILWYDLLLETDADGQMLSVPNPITVTADKIVSDRAYHDIQPKHFYHFSILTLSDQIQYPIRANSFVIKKNLNSPLQSTSRSALGSGIYGKYIDDVNEIDSLITQSGQLVYKIDSSYSYIIQDKEHGESITIASLNTNRYMDRIIQSLRGDRFVTFESALNRIQTNESSTIFTLWNIVFYRTNDTITKLWLDYILADYAFRYINDDSLVDTINNNIIQELPINDIMKHLGYEGLLASDPYNNGWDRGCISYNYLDAAIIQGETAKY